MVGVIDGFRWAIVGDRAQLYWPSVFISIGLVAFMLITGIVYFRNTERTFADVI
jgi:lipopolysaccharide transport system permease protein